MSIFNVGTGREPAEIGVAEYQKPDYQQFEKLANINMQLKQAELEKAQKKTKEWEDILTKDYSTEYGIEQSQLINKRMGSIKERILNDWSKNPSLANDPTYMFKVKSEMNQVGGWVKSLDIQHKNILETRKKIEEDTKGIAYDKAYATDYLKAQDNPEEFFSKNPDGEVGKLIEGIINTPQIQAIKDPDERRMVIREAMQASPIKRGTIARNTDPTMGKLGHDDVLYESQNGSNKGFDVVSRPKIITSLMGHAGGMVDKDSNTTYEDAWKDKLIYQYGDENTALEQIKAKYIVDYDNMQKQYGNNPKIEGLRDLPPPDKITPSQLIKYSFADNYASRYTDRQEHNTTPRNIVNIHNGDGDKNKQIGTTSRQKLQLSPKFTTSGVVTTLNPKDNNLTVKTDIVYNVDNNGNVTRIVSKGGGVGTTALMKNVRPTLVMVHKNTGKIIPEALKQKILKNPSKYKDQVFWNTGMSVEQDFKNADGSSKKQMGLMWGYENKSAMSQVISEFENGDYDKPNMWMPASQYDNTFTLDEGIAIENGDNSIRSSSVYGAKKKPVKPIVKKK